MWIIGDSMSKVGPLSCKQEVLTAHLCCTDVYLFSLSEKLHLLMVALAPLCTRGIAVRRQLSVGGQGW